MTWSGCVLKNIKLNIKCDLSQHYIQCELQVYYIANILSLLSLQKLVVSSVSIIGYLGVLMPMMAFTSHWIAEAIELKEYGLQCKGQTITRIHTVVYICSARVSKLRLCIHMHSIIIQHQKLNREERAESHVLGIAIIIPRPYRAPNAFQYNHEQVYRLPTWQWQTYHMHDFPLKFLRCHKLNAECWHLELFSLLIESRVDEII